MYWAQDPGPWVSQLEMQQTEDLHRFFFFPKDSFTNQLSTLLVGGFKYVFIFTSILGKISHFDQYFVEMGWKLKPSTSKKLFGSFWLGVFPEVMLIYFSMINFGW